MRVLVVEDNDELADVIARALRRNALAVDVAPDGASALNKVAANSYDVVVLDRALPRVHGDDVCRRIAATETSAKVIMLTASASLEEKVAGLALGADDYLPKPFAMEELVARVRALGRRSSIALPPVLRRNGVVLDPARRTVTRDGCALRLTNREFGVLEHLMSVDGAVASAEDLMERVWDDRLDPLSNAVRVTVLTLRRKLGAPPLIETVPGAGYRLLDEAT